MRSNDVNCICGQERDHPCWRVFDRIEDEGDEYANLLFFEEVKKCPTWFLTFIPMFSLSGAGSLALHGSRLVHQLAQDLDHFLVVAV